MTSFTFLTKNLTKIWTVTRDSKLAGFSRVALLSAIALFVMPVAADVYQKIDDDGKIYFTNRPTGHGFRLVMKTPKKGTVAYKNFVRNRELLSPMIRTEASRNQVDPALVLAVVHAESAYDPNAVSHAGATGLMQLMPETAKKYGVKNPKNPTQNIQGGSQYLRDLLELFEFDLRLALAAYNAGETAVIKHGRKIPPYPETQHYVSRVIDYYQTYLDGRLY